MLKISGAYGFTKKKIARNKLTLKSYDMHFELMENEITIKREIQDNIQKRRQIMKIINSLEEKQATEFLVSRNMIINNLLSQISRCELSENSKNLIEKNKKILSDISQNNKAIMYIQSSIPKQGSVTNYKFVQGI